MRTAVQKDARKMKQKHTVTYGHEDPLLSVDVPLLNGNLVFDFLPEKWLEGNAVYARVTSRRLPEGRESFPQDFDVGHDRD